MNSLASQVQKKVVVLNEDTPLVQAARAMADQGIGCVVVVDHQGRVSGVLTDRDLACDGIGYSVDPETPIIQLMSEKPITATEDTPIEKILDLMVANGVRRIPILERVPDPFDQPPKCVGLVSFDDLIVSGQFFAEQLGRVVKSQLLRLRRSPGVGSASQTVGVHRAQERSEARSQQTLHRFYHELMRHLEWDEERTAAFTQFILSSLVRRLHYTAAEHFISQLPKKLQDDLLDLPAGPDRKVNPTRIVQELQLRFSMDEAKAKVELRRFCLALQDYIGHSAMAHVLAQLPEDFKSLFERSSSTPLAA